MIYAYSLVIIALSSLLWRIRGGLWKDYIPMNKIWYSLFVACLGCVYFGWYFENFLIGFVDCYASYQLYGWGLYLGCLLGGVACLNPYRDFECELIDDLLYSIEFSFKGKKVYLYEYPKAFGFLGTTLTGLIMSFLWGLFFADIGIMLSGLGMGVCYWLGGKLEKLYKLGKDGWNWGEIIFGAYVGVIFAWKLLW